MAEATDILSEIADLYHRGLYLQAYHKSQALGPLASWTGTRARVLAGRLAANLGGHRLSNCLHYLSWRTDRKDEEANYFYAHTMFVRGRLIAARRCARRLAESPNCSATVRADSYALIGHLSSLFRDFHFAHRCLKTAMKLAPKRAWIWIQWAAVLEHEDRQSESLEAAQRAFELRPWYRPGVQVLARELQLANRDREALELLTEACQRLESGNLLGELAELQRELGHYVDARKSYDRMPELLPLTEKDYRQAIDGRRADAAYDCGDFDQSLALTKESSDPFYAKVAEHLSAATEADKRVMLPVGFVRQHHMTCAPATLSAISNYWKRPADHLQVAEKICYDGTPAHSERSWAEQNGYHAREFTVTWEAAKALIDRGIPFTLTTVESTNAHLQATIGYDGRRRTLLIRDPSIRKMGECLADALVERYQSTGPRGMLLAPLHDAARLAEVELPDAELYDLLYRLQSALNDNDRESAAAAHDQMQNLAPQHRLTLHARRTLAGYDFDPAGALLACEQLMVQFPKDANLQLTKLSCLRDLARRDDRLKLLEEIASQPGSDPVFWLQWAEELTDDARDHPRALRLLRKYLRIRPLEPHAYLLLAIIRWRQRKFHEALEYYRIAVCLNDRDERYAAAFFSASQWLKLTESALDMLRDRFRRFGAKSSQPARTLYWAYQVLDRTDEAFAVLKEATALRPDDTELTLYLAEEYGRIGRLADANALLAAAQPHAHALQWSRTAALLREFEGDSTAALGHWRSVLEQAPSAGDAHSSIAQLLAESAGREAAVAHLQQAAERFPHNLRLLQLWIEWLRDGDAATTEQGIRKLLEVNPVDTWARRELALALTAQRRLDEALTEIAQAIKLEPTNSYSFTVLARVHESAGRVKKAMEANRAALRLSVDNEYAISSLIQLCETNEERRAELAFIYDELVRQTTFGAGLAAYRSVASNVLDAKVLLSDLQRGLKARPDLWNCWSTVVRQLLDMEQVSQAKDLAKQAAARFPLVPAVLLDLAAASRAAQDDSAELAALQQALQINPSWGVAVGELAAFHQRRGDLASATQLLERAVARTPLDVVLHGHLAELLWQSDKRSEALARLEHAVRLSPGYGWAWEMLKQWGAEAGMPDAAAKAARDLTSRRPLEARSWLTLARALGEKETTERVKAAERAIQLNPRLTEGYTQLIYALVDAQRFDEALAACCPAVFGKQPPLELKSHAAWIESCRRDYPAAIRRMRIILAKDGEYFLGWKMLHEWLNAVRDMNGCAEASTRLVQLAPNDPEMWVFLGDAKKQLQDTQGAKQAYGRALELLPTYEYAGDMLFDLQLVENDLPAAERTMHILCTGNGAGTKKAAEVTTTASRNVPLAQLVEEIDTSLESVSEFVLARYIQLACRLQRIHEAIGGLRRLCRHTSQERWPILTAVAAMLDQGWYAAAEQELWSALSIPHVNPKVADCWVDSCVRQDKWKRCRKLLQELQNRRELWVSASSQFVHCAVEAGKADEFAAYVKSHGALLAADHRTWSTVGCAFSRMGEFASAVHWLRDWKSRTNVNPGALHSLALSYRYTGQEHLAIECHRSALKLPEESTTPLHAILLASSELLDGHTAEACELVAKVGSEDLDSFYQALLALVQIGIELLDGSTSAGARSYHSARRRLLKHVEKHIYQIFSQRLLKLVYHRLLRQCALRSRSYHAVVWHWIWEQIKLGSSMSTRDTAAKRGK